MMGYRSAPPPKPSDWSKYFSDLMDQNPKDADKILDHWAGCIDSGKYRPMRPAPPCPQPK